MTLINQKTRQEKQLDASLFAEGEVLKTKETPYETEIPKQSTGALVIAEDKDSAGEIISAEEDKQLAEDKTPQTKEEIRYFQWNANNVENIFEENKSIYKEIWEATDLLITTKEDGVKEDLILKNSSAPTKFDYLVETVGLRLETSASGGLVFLDETGQEKFFVPAPDVTDVTGKKVTDGIRYELGWSNLEESLELGEERVESGDVSIATGSVASDAGIELEKNSATETGSLVLSVEPNVTTGSTASGVIVETLEKEV